MNTSKENYICAKVEEKKPLVLVQFEKNTKKNPYVLIQFKTKDYPFGLIKSFENKKTANEYFNKYGNVTQKITTRNKYEKIVIEFLSCQLENCDKFQRINSENDKLFVIGIFDENGIFDDYQDCIDMNEKSESDCYRTLIILNGKTPMC